MKRGRQFAGAMLGFSWGKARSAWIGDCARGRPPRLRPLPIEQREAMLFDSHTMEPASSRSLAELVSRAAVDEGVDQQSGRAQCSDHEHGHEHD